MGQFTTGRQYMAKEGLRWRNVWLISVMFYMILVFHVCDVFALEYDLTDLSIEELANIEVTSVSRTPQKLAGSAAAIFVITAEDIRRSGVTSIPEALRMVPGLDVARISSSKWAVSSRGFNSRYSNKLLVLLDGRSLYLPTFSGVFWENQDLFIEDIERIEVVRGPGASLWGSNAVNGVISIITKHAKDSLGIQAVAGGGDYEKGFARARWGEPLNANSYIRAYASYFSRNEMIDKSQNGLDDAWDKYQTGFRSDNELGENGNLTVQGDIYKCMIDEVSTILDLNPPYYKTLELENNITGYNILSRYTRRLTGGSEMAVQLYLDSMDKEEGTVRINDRIVDMDVQFRLRPMDIHEIVWGFGYRLSTDEIQSPLLGINFETEKRDDSLYSSFVQDTLTLNDNFQLILGSRFEHNEYTGFEAQPNARILWEFSESNLIWAAVSRAIRTPSRGDNDIRFTQRVIPAQSIPVPPDGQLNSLPIAVTIWGLSNYNSENLMAYEIGHRLKAIETFFLDSTAFIYRYDNMSTYERGDAYVITDNNPPYILQPLYVGNRMSAKTWGAEISANWQPFPFMKFIGTYTFYEADLTIDDTPTLAGAIYSDNDSPKHQASLRATFDMPHNLEMDVWARYVDDILDGNIDQYTEMDVRLGWKASKHLDLSLCAQNIFHKSHPEYVENYVLNKPAEVPRSVYGKITLKY